jgi:hypothetical protein
MLRLYALVPFCSRPTNRGSLRAHCTIADGELIGAKDQRHPAAHIRSSLSSDAKAPSQNLSISLFGIPAARNALVTWSTMEKSLAGPASFTFPTEHRKHLRTTNVIESSFATIRHRTVRAKGCLSNKTALAIFKLAEAAERSWRRSDGHNQLPKLILGVRFADGIEVVRSQAQAAA